jgi:hypothetical protein
MYDYEGYLPNPNNTSEGLMGSNDPPPPSPHDDVLYELAGESQSAPAEAADTQFKVPAPRKRSLRNKVMMIRAFQGLAHTVATKANISQVSP